MALVKVDITVKIEGYDRPIFEPALLGYAIEAVLDEGTDLLVLAETIRAAYQSAVADAERRLSKLAFYEVARQLTPVSSEKPTPGAISRFESGARRGMDVDWPSVVG